MKIYRSLEDFNNKKELVGPIDFGIVNFGSNKIVDIFLYNDTKATLVDIEINTNNAEVKVLNCPITMLPNSLQNIKLEWVSNVLNIDGLQCLLSINYGSLRSKAI